MIRFLFGPWRVLAALAALSCGGAWPALVVAESEGEGKDEAAASEDAAETAEADEADEALPEGHSVHGEVFNEGPRQAAQMIAGTGEIDFPVTTEVPEAQAFFNQGVGQLHGFWYFEAERSFRQVLKLDPDCAMAYWGLTMSNFSNKKRAVDFIAKAKEGREQVSDREKLWIDSLAKFFEKPDADEKGRRRQLVRDLESIVEAHPDDVEAKAFLLYQIYHNSRQKNGYAIPSHLAINLLAEAIFADAPNHPSHHYRIHLWDSEDPAEALDSAALCGPAAPGIAHMWHMPGHIYSKLHRYADAAWQQEASARVDHAHQMRYWLIPDQIHNFAHNNEWLIRNLNYAGRASDALDLAKNMIELPRLPEWTDDGKKWKHSGSSWAYGRTRLRDTLVRFERWETLLALAETDYLAVGPDDISEHEWHRLVGQAAFQCGRTERGEEALAVLQAALDEETAKRDKAVADAEKKNRDAKKSDKEIEAAKKKAGDNFAKTIDGLKKKVDQLKVLSLVSRTADSPEDTAHLDEAVGILDQLKSVDESWMAKMYLACSKADKAIEIIAKEVASSPGQVVPLAHQVQILLAAGKFEDAAKAFATLRERAAHADTDLPIFASLAESISSLDAPARKTVLAGVDLDAWQAEPEAADDLGERPPLDDLGPFRWSPPSAPGWTLTDGDGEPVSLADFRGEPVLLIFYLGKGCVHCMEQLQTFAPMHGEYADAGISIVAVGSDSEAGLRETWDTSKDGENDPYPFPLLSDEALDQFKAYRAFDDFENSALHGTFLIDGEGHIRWQDISYQPFMKAEWLLEECRRLLALDSAGS